MAINFALFRIRFNVPIKGFSPFILRTGYHTKQSDIDLDEDDFRNSRPSYNDHYMKRGQRHRSGFKQNRFNDKYGNGFAGGGLSRIDWDKVDIEPVEKNFYKPSNLVLQRSQEEISDFRKKHNMTVKGCDIPNPIINFSDYDFPSSVQEMIQRENFEKPTAIQAQGWPIAMSGRDFIGIGETGSGKTFGYTLPALVHISSQSQLRPGEGPIGLVIAPTRELVQQINQVAVETFGRNQRGNVACLFGGASKNVQSRQLEQTPSLCVATPGRLLDFLEMGVTDLRRCSFLVLDEADRMLDMGFEPQIRKIVEQIRPDRQTLMWTATWPEEVRELSRDYLRDPVHLTVGSSDLAANPNISQDVLVCGVFEKRERFIENVTRELQGNEDKMKILVFAQTKSQVDILSRMLHREGIRSRGIHGDYSQSARDNTLNGFRSGRFSVLIATDVASRGLDVNDISLVVNFDFPTDIETYIHRIGRTGRAGKDGRALSILTEKDSGVARGLIGVLQKAGQHVPPQLVELEEMQSAARYNKKLERNYNRRYRFRAR